MDRKPLNERYASTIDALDTLNSFVGVLTQYNTLPTSYVGNVKPEVAKTLEQKLWVAGHGALRDTTAMIGGLLDVDRLTDADMFKEKYTRFETSQHTYQMAVRSILEGASASLAEKMDRGHLMTKVLLFTGLLRLNDRRVPMIERFGDLDKLRLCRFPGSKEAWNTLDTASGEMKQAIDGMEDIAARQNTLPLTWKDAKGIKHHVVLTTETHPSLRGVCFSMMSYNIIRRYGQINPLTVPPQYQSFIDADRQYGCGHINDFITISGAIGWH